jgi:hypothetical protein
MKASRPTHQNIRILIILSIAILLSGKIFSQQDTIKKYIFIPHPRSDDQNHQGSISAIEKIDFSKFDLKLLGGDLAYYTSIDRVSMDHLDSIYDLGSANTLWTFGNHDVANPDLIAEYTGKPRHYAFNKDNITFLVLDTEIGSSGFVSSHITPPQVEMIQSVLDTIADCRYLILLHHRLLWMIGNDYFSVKIDSVGESTRQLDTSNFNQVVFPLLQQIKHKGIQVICLGGDKSKINFIYSPEDSITYIASTMGPEFSDEVNDVVILTHDMIKDTLTWNYLPLSEVEKKPVVGIDQNHVQPDNPVLIYSDVQNQQLVIQLIIENITPIDVSIFDMSGRIIQSLSFNNGIEKYTIPVVKKGIYVVKVKMEDLILTRKILF